MIQPNIYIEQAVKLENSKSVFEYLSNDIRIQRYEKISELYEKAGNICKISNKELAIEYFIKAYNYLVNLDSDDYKLKRLLSELSELYLKINYVKSIECLEKILNWYTIKGDISNVIKTKKSIGDIYFDNNCFKEAYLVYVDVLEIINLNDKCIDIKRNVVEKISEIYYNNESIINLLELSKLYFIMADYYIKKNIVFLSARNFILGGLLMNLAMDDIVQANNNYEMYSSKDNTFQSSREGIFVSKIINSVDTNDYDEISFLCAEYDKVKPLDKIQVKLLIKIKENIGFIDLANDNVNTNNDDEIEDDLC